MHYSGCGLFDWQVDKGAAAATPTDDKWQEQENNPGSCIMDESSSSAHHHTTSISRWRHYLLTESQFTYKITGNALFLYILL